MKRFFVLIASCSLAGVTLGTSGATSQNVARMVVDSLKSARGAFRDQIGALEFKTQSGYRLYVARSLGASVPATCRIGVSLASRTLMCRLPSRRSLAIAVRAYEPAINSVMKENHFAESRCPVEDVKKERCYKWSAQSPRRIRVSLNILPGHGNLYVPDFQLRPFRSDPGCRYSQPCRCRGAPILVA